jgi:hypothetical protein
MSEAAPEATGRSKRSPRTVHAERIAAGKASALRAELDRRRQWRVWRRLRWALRGDRH